jgi:hypothetical protein
MSDMLKEDLRTVGWTGGGTYGSGVGARGGRRKIRHDGGGGAPLHDASFGHVLVKIRDSVFRIEIQNLIRDIDCFVVTTLRVERGHALTQFRAAPLLFQRGVGRKVLRLIREAVAERQRQHRGEKE